MSDQPLLLVDPDILAHLAGDPEPQLGSSIQACGLQRDPCPVRCPLRHRSVSGALAEHVPPLASEPRGGSLKVFPPSLQAFTSGSFSSLTLGAAAAQPTNTLASLLVSDTRPRGETPHLGSRTCSPGPRRSTSSWCPSAGSICSASTSSWLDGSSWTRPAGGSSPSTRLCSPSCLGRWACSGACGWWADGNRGDVARPPFAASACAATW